MIVNFMGLTGPVGELPLYYNPTGQRTPPRAHDRSLSEFLDIFNHRIHLAVLPGLEKYASVDYERGAGQIPRTTCWTSSPGTEGLEEPAEGGRSFLVYYAGLLGQHPRSAVRCAVLEITRRPGGHPSNSREPGIS